MQGHDALARLERGVGGGVAHDEGAALGDDLLHDAVADPALGIADRGLVDVAGGAHHPAPVAVAAARALEAGRAAGHGRLEQQDEALLRVGELDDVVEHGAEEIVEVGLLQELLAEAEELSYALDLVRAERGRLGGGDPGFLGRGLAPLLELSLIHI